MSLTIQQYFTVATEPKVLHKKALECAGDIKKAELKQDHFGTITVELEGKTLIVTKNPHEAIELYNSLTY